MLTESVPLEWRGKHAEDNPSWLIASHTAYISSPDLELRSNEQQNMSATLIGVLLGFIMAMYVGYLFKLRELRSSKSTTRSEADQVLAEIKKQAEMTAPSSLPSSTGDKLKAALEAVPSDEAIEELQKALTRYQPEQYPDSTMMLNTIRETLNGFSSIKAGYNRLSELSKKVNTFADNDALQSDRASFVAEYERLFTLYLSINIRNLHSGDNQALDKLCTEISRYYQVALATYMVHSALLSNYPID